MQPRLRFKGFNDNWEQKQLSDIFNKIKNAYVGTVRKYYTNKNNGHFYLESNNIKHGKISKDSQVFVNDYFYRKQRKNWLHTGDIVMVQSGAVGDSAVINENMNNTAAHAVIIISKPKRKVNSYFFNDAFQSKYFKKEIYKIAIGNTIVHILSSDIKSTPVKVPNIHEQRLIGFFFAKLDRLITLQQSKLDLLKKQKKGYLQKLFPRKNEAIPRVRFNGFHDRWMKCKLKDLGKIYTGNTPKKKDKDNYTNNGMPWVTPTDINGIYIRDTPLELSNKGIKRAKVVPSHSILVTCIASIGKNTLTTFNSSFNQQINALIPNEDTDYYFLYVQSYFWSQYMIHIAPKGTMQIINKSTFSNIETKIPSLAEQRLIGQFFKRLDDNISLQNDKLNYLRKLKKAYLQKMFC